MNKIMTKKVFYGVHATLLLIAAMFFTACAEDVAIEGETTKIVAGEDPEGYMSFTAVAPEDTRTSITKTGEFRWSEGDHVFVKDDDGVWQESGDAQILSSGQAKFLVKGKFTRTVAETATNPYPVLYPGNGNSLTKVTIPAKQIQDYANNSEHIDKYGDCAIAGAKRRASDDKFEFTLQHQMAYLLFEPRVSTEGKEVKLRKITLTEVTEPTPQNICGEFAWDENGIPDGHIVAGAGSNVIKILCGKDVEAIEKGDLDATTLDNTEQYQYGFLVKNFNASYAEYDGDTHADGTTPLARVFMVIRPGTYKLKVLYEYSVNGVVEQRAHHIDIYGDEEPIQWTPITDGHTTYRDVALGDAQTFLKNHYYRIRHRLDVTEPTVDTDKVYNFNQYYMWGAENWLWNGVSSYPVYYNETKADELPEEGDSRWFDNNYSSASAVRDYNKGSGNYSTIIYNWVNDGNIRWINRDRHQQAQKNSIWKSNTLTANQMSFYVVYGDPHYDNVTPWILQNYNGTRTICYGGVWLRKKSAIEAILPLGITWPDGNDGSTWTNLCAPFPQKEKIVDAYWEYDEEGKKSTLKQGHLQELQGNRFNLRYCAPPKNIRMPYTNFNYDTGEGQFDKKPWELDPSKNESDYFFVPCLGQFDYWHKDNVGQPTLVLVGAEGFYWTKTPLQYNGGADLKCYYGNDSGNGADNAFYLNIHNKYIALSWDQPKQYVKTGMRIARTSGGTGEVVFE